MPALTVKQPWAGLIMVRAKDVENRTWPVPQAIRGELDVGTPVLIAIHAAKRYDADAWKQWSDTRQAPPSHPTPSYPVGVILGTVSVTGCHHAHDCTTFPAAFMEQPRCSPWAERDVYHWTLADPQPLTEPIPARGRQRVWTVPDDWFT